LHFPFSSLQKDNIYDHIKFDRINLYDFRRNLPAKQLQSKIDLKMNAYGFGKRKKSRALVRVHPGTGKIMVNNEPLLQTLLMPM
jgi:hypothetical protein